MNNSGQTTDRVAATDIAIVGGGMVGAALAALLARAHVDWSITLIETFPLPAVGAPAFLPSYDDRSTAIAHGSVLLLQQLGIWQTLEQHATPIHQVHVSDRGHLGGGIIDRHDAGVDALGYVIPNAWIGRVLLSHLQALDNVQLLAPATVTQLRPQVGGTCLTFEHEGIETNLHTQLAVIVDGAESNLRASLGIDVESRDYRQTAVIANVSLQQSHRSAAFERFTDTGPMALLPLGNSGDGQECALVWTHPSDRADAIMALSDADFLKELQTRFGFRLGYFTAVGKRDSYPLRLMVAGEQVRSSIAVMGNAAHFLHPVAGQGFNLALRDCAALTDSLKRAAQTQRPLGDLKILQAYVERQALDQQATITFSDQLTKLFSSASLPAAALRALGFIGLECLPPVKNGLTQQTMGNASRRVIL